MGEHEAADLDARVPRCSHDTCPYALHMQALLDSVFHTEKIGKASGGVKRPHAIRHLLVTLHAPLRRPCGPRCPPLLAAPRHSSPLLAASPPPTHRECAKVGETFSKPSVFYRVFPVDEHAIFSVLKNSLRLSRTRGRRRRSGAGEGGRIRRRRSVAAGEGGRETGGTLESRRRAEVSGGPSGEVGEQVTPAHEHL